jgi:hypothetical protein
MAGMMGYSPVILNMEQLTVSLALSIILPMPLIPLFMLKKTLLAVMVLPARLIHADVQL